MAHDMVALIGARERFSPRYQAMRVVTTTTRAAAASKASRPHRNTMAAEGGSSDDEGGADGGGGAEASSSAPPKVQLPRVLQERLTPRSDAAIFMRVEKELRVRLTSCALLLLLSTIL
jgi:hypothetical protein